MSTQAYKDIDEIVIARVVKARGIRGEVSCVVETDFPERFSSLKEARLWMADGTHRILNVEDQWFHKDRIILKFEGYDTMTAARSLVGGRVVISEQDLKPLIDGEFFEHQLIGSDAVSLEGQNLGQVTRLLRTGGTDVLVLRSGDGRERLIPFADEICVSVDVNAKLITVDLPDGLLQL